MPDYYKILNISRTASLNEIKAAYRNLAFKFHPDLHKDDSSKLEQFKNITNAYKILSDETARSKYDVTYVDFSQPYQKAKQKASRFHKISR